LIRLATLLVVAALAGCAHAPTPYTYACEDGRTVVARYEGDRAMLEIGGVHHTLTTAMSASGARYVGDGLQWWTKGFSEATLAVLPAGEEIAPPGVRCVSPGQ
jgi:membrane-bound inhibitor of C-type lysozyme